MALGPKGLAQIKTNDQRLYLMSQMVTIGVIGAGVFGGFHAQKLSQIKGVHLGGILDAERNRAENLAQKYGCQAFGEADWDGFVSQLDALIIASPAQFHYEWGYRALEAGLHVYCEKPLAYKASEAHELALMANQRERILSVGHQERAVFEAMGLFSVPETPIRLEAIRNGTPSPRNLDVSVVMDLMIHDLDLALALMDKGDEGYEVEAIKCRQRNQSDEMASERVLGADEVSVTLKFPHSQAHFHSSRIATERARRMTITYPSGTVFIDFLERRFENSTGFALNSDFSETEYGKDPLGASVSRFVLAIRGQALPLCSGKDGAAAVKSAELIDSLSGF